MLAYQLSHFNTIAILFSLIPLNTYMALWYVTCTNTSSFFFFFVVLQRFSSCVLLSLISKIVIISYGSYISCIPYSIMKGWSLLFPIRPLGCWRQWRQSFQTFLMVIVYFIWHSTRGTICEGLPLVIGSHWCFCWYRVPMPLLWNYSTITFIGWWLRAVLEWLTS